MQMMLIRERTLGITASFYFHEKYIFWFLIFFFLRCFIWMFHLTVALPVVWTMSLYAYWLFSGTDSVFRHCATATPAVTVAPKWYGPVSHTIGPQMVWPSVSIGPQVIWPSASLFWFPSGMARCLTLLVPKWYGPVSHTIGSHEVLPGVSHYWFPSGMAHCISPLVRQ